MRGAIEGKNAREYASKVAKRTRSKFFNKLILKNIKNGGKVKICDLCCGPGNTIELLKDKVGEIYGVDISREMIKICREKFGKNRKIKLKLGSSTKTRLKSNYFDFVIIRMGLHHIKDKEKVLCEANRILKNKGRLIIIDKYYTSFIKYWAREINNLITRRHRIFFNHFIISKKDYEKMMPPKHFKIIKKRILPYREGSSSGQILYVLEKTN